MSGDIILTMVLIYVLRKSRTGVNKYVSPSAASRYGWAGPRDACD